MLMLRRQLLSVITLCNLAAVASSANGIKNEVLARSSAAVGAAPEIDDGSEESLAQAADEANNNGGVHIENHTPPVPSVVAPQDAPQRSQRELAETTSYSASVVELQAALANPTVDRIVLAAGTYEFDSSTACSSESWLCVDRAVTIEAAEVGTVVLDAKGSRRVVYITGAGVQLVRLKITGGNTGGYAPSSKGGGLYIASGGYARLEYCDISGNTATYGGGLQIDSGGSAILDYCEISSNIASGYGWGGGLSIKGYAKLNSCQISNNHAIDGWGGGLIIRSGGAATLDSCQINQNTASFSGGGLHISGYTVLTCCTVEDPIYGSNYDEHDCPSLPCFDTNDGATDLDGDGCTVGLDGSLAYENSPSWCGDYDDPDFSSNEMCCACGGGTTTAPSSTGDPVTTFQGREMRYYLSTRRFTPVLDQGPIVVSQLAGPANPPPGLEALKGAWVVAMEVDVAAMDKVLIETIDPTTLLVHPNATALPATTDALTTMRLSVGGKQLAAGEHKLSVANAAATLSAKRIGSKRRIGSGWVEQITITADGLELRITSAKANKFADEQHQVLGLHLDVEFLTFDQSAVRGALPEMWGLQPMTEKTKLLLDKKSADN